MYKTNSQTIEYLKELANLTADIDRTKMTLFVIPSFTALESSRRAVGDDKILLGAQNMHWKSDGQFTGEISPVMLKELGMNIIEIGHSERRHVMGESMEETNKKVLAAIEHGFTALLCVGETAFQKDNGICDEVLAMQLKVGLKGVKQNNLRNVWIAYEPVWAIGEKGVPASSAYADEKHSVIKDVLTTLYSDSAKKVPVLYGGSVNPKNCENLINCSNIDGLFIGRSAWDAESFNSIIRKVL